MGFLLFVVGLLFGFLLACYGVVLLARDKDYIDGNWVERDK